MVIIRRMNKFFAIILCLFNSFFTTSQIKIQDVGDGWKASVNSAIEMIKITDTASYRLLIDECKEIEFIIGNRSSTKPPYIIAISTEDLKINSINNIASILVHESWHLYFYNHRIVYEANYEESMCYKKEYEFVSKLFYVEDWLFKNIINNFLYYRYLSFISEK